MKEMIYDRFRSCEVLHDGEYKNHKFCILSLGTHPTAYVENRTDCGSYYDDRLDEIDVHCGFTYGGNAYWNDEDKTSYLGWDYAHYCDYKAFYLSDCRGKKWTTAEIFEEVKSVIDQLIGLEEKIANEGQEQ